MILLILIIILHTLKNYSKDNIILAIRTLMKWQKDKTQTSEPANDDKVSITADKSILDHQSQIPVKCLSTDEIYKSVYI